MGKGAVLFLCWGNACRSIMAEALTRHHWGEEVKVMSAGMGPLGHIPPETLIVLEEIGVSTEGLRSKGLEELKLEAVDLVVNLSGYDPEGYLPPTLEGTRLINWYVRDPYGGSLDSFRQTRNAIEWLVTKKLPQWLREDQPLSQKPAAPKETRDPSSM